MSQRTHVVRIRHKGAPVFLGNETRTAEDGTLTSEPVWSSDAERIAQWMAAGFRTRFNQRRSCRSQYLSCLDREGKRQIVTDPAGAPALVPIGSNVVAMSDKTARVAFSYLAALPGQVLAASERIEDQDWWAAIKRRQSLAKNGQAPGGMPRFRSAKKEDARFVCWFNGGRNAVYVQTGRKSGMVTLSGMNPTAWRQPGVKGCRWRVTLHVRLSQPIREYTSVRVNLTRRELVFVNAPLPVTGRAEHPVPIGLDRGVTHTVADSLGRFYDAPDTTALDRARKSHARRMAKSRVVALREHRLFYESNRYQAHKQAMARTSATIERVRTNFAHNLSTRLVRESDVIVVERLQLRNMTRRGKGKRGLNRVMQNAALGRVAELIAYKAKLAGVEYVEVNPAYTSQECNKCGQTSRENRESQAVFLCIRCGHTANADTNAARNILGRWLARTGQDDALAGSDSKSRDAHAFRAAASNREPLMPAVA